MEIKYGEIKIERESLNENEKIIKSICSTKLGICNIVHVAEYKFYFGLQNKEGYKMLIHSCNGNRTVFAKRIYCSLSGNITVINPLNQPKVEIKYTKDLKLIKNKNNGSIS